MPGTPGGGIPILPGMPGWDHVHPLAPPPAPIVPVIPQRSGMPDWFFASYVVLMASLIQILSRRQRRKTVAHGCATCGAVQHTTADHQEALAEMGTE